VALLPIGFQGLAKLHPAPDNAMGFNAVELERLAAIMDEIIPAGDGSPAASVTGGPQYLQYLGWQYPTWRGWKLHQIIRLSKKMIEGFVGSSIFDFRLVCRKCAIRFEPM
jgi:hypothetical protein